MAERRMFAKTIIDSDAFLDMPLSTQALYFHLCMRADDDGFINNPKKIQRMIGASDDDMKVLSAKKFIIPFESGVVVIKHWKIHNYIQSDRYKETAYLDEKASLTVKQNKAYTLKEPDMDTECIQDVYKVETQVRLGKSEDRDSIGKVNNKYMDRPTVSEVAEYIAEKGYHFSAEAFVAFYDSNGWKVGRNPMRSWKSACVTWENNYKKQPNQGKSWQEVAEALERELG